MSDFDTAAREFVESAFNGMTGKGNEDIQVEPPEPDLIEEAEDGVDTSGNAKFSEVFGMLGVTGIDHSIQVFDKEHWPEEMRQFIPEPDSTYVFDPEALEGVVMAIQHNEKCNITGPAGCGKTTLIKEVAARTNRPYMRINGKDGVEVSSMLGNYVVESGDVVWKDGLLPIAVKNGYLLAFDEWTKVPAGIMMALQWLLEDEGKLLIDDMQGEFHEKLIEPHSNFRMVLCDNVKGLGDGLDKFAATNVQDTATLNRFGINLTMDYMVKDSEVQMLRNKYGKISDNFAGKMVDMANQIRSSYKAGNVSLTLSPRNLMKWAKSYILYRDRELAFRWAYYNSLADDTEKSHVEQLYDRVFNTSLVK